MKSQSGKIHPGPANGNYPNSFVRGILGNHNCVGVAVVPSTLRSEYHKYPGGARPRLEGFNKAGNRLNVWSKQTNARMQAPSLKLVSLAFRKLPVASYLLLRCPAPPPSPPNRCEKCLDPEICCPSPKRIKIATGSGFVWR